MSAPTSSSSAETSFGDVELLIEGWPNNDNDVDRIHLGEGPLYDHRSGHLYFVDILGSAVHSYHTTTHKHHVISVKRHVGTIVLSQQEGWLWCALPDGIYHLDTTTGTLHDVGLYMEKEIINNRFNDGKCDPKGRFWVGSMCYDESDTGRERGALYRLEMDEKQQQTKINKILDKISTSNGLAWSPDTLDMWYIDSGHHHVDHLQLNEQGDILKREKAWTIEKGIPDGMTIDKEGMIWVAHWGGGCITRWDPSTSRCIGTIRIPGVSRVTCCTFGGPELRDLYITTASKDANRNDEPHAGSLYVVRNAGQGVAAVPFQTNAGKQ